MVLPTLLRPHPPPGRHMIIRRLVSSWLLLSVLLSSLPLLSSSVSSVDSNLSLSAAAVDQKDGPAAAAAAAVGEQPVLHNWGLSVSFNPARIVTPTSISQIVDIIKNTRDYPSPVRPLGSVHSVTQCVMNERGTVVIMTAMNAILGLQQQEARPPGQGSPSSASSSSKGGGGHGGRRHHDQGSSQAQGGRRWVRVQAGARLLQVHHWLTDKGLELAFAPEIGDATVGSLVGSVSKDSGVAPDGDDTTGTMYKIVNHVTYVNASGDVLVLDEETTPRELALFKCSEGVTGIVVEVGLLVRDLHLVRYTNTIMATQELLEWYRRGGLNLSSSSSQWGVNYWMVVRPDYSLVQRRELLHGLTSKEQEAIMTNQTEQRRAEVIGNFTRDSFGKGKLPFPLNKEAAERPPLSWVTPRHHMVNHYGPTNANGPRLDFTWFEYPIERFDKVVADFMDTVQRFSAAHDDFAPTGCAVYFVRRVPGKPYGWFSQQGPGFDHPGHSFTLDPIYHDPNHQLWRLFLQESVAFALAHGGRIALTQTRLITPADYAASPASLPPAPSVPLPINNSSTTSSSSRFLTPFFASFLLTPPNATITSSSSNQSTPRIVP